MTTEKPTVEHRNNDAGRYRGPDRRASMGTGSDYRGPDRRLLSVRGPSSDSVRNLVFGLAAVIVVVVVVHGAVVVGNARLATFTTLRDASAGFLVLAGSLALVGWALTGRVARAFDGAALLSMGGGLLLLAGPWSSLIQENRTLILVSPGIRLALAVPALVLLARSPREAPVDSTVRAQRVLAVAVAGAIGLLAIEALVRLVGGVEHAPVWIALTAAVSAGWLGVGAMRLRVTRAVRQGDRALGAALVGYGLGNALIAVTLAGHLRWGIAGASLQLVAAAFAARAAISWLLALLSTDGTVKLRLQGELSDVSVVLEGEILMRRRLQHDARNVVAAVRAATTTLERHGDHIDAETQEQLRRGVGSELGRLQRLLDAPGEAPRRTAGPVPS